MLWVEARPLDALHHPSYINFNFSDGYMILQAFGTGVGGGGVGGLGTEGEVGVG